MIGLALSVALAAEPAPLFAPGPRRGEWQPERALQASLLWGAAGLVGGGLAGAAIDLFTVEPGVTNAVSFALVGSMVGATAGVHRFSAARFGWEGLGSVIGGAGGVAAGSLLLLVGQAVPPVRPVTIVAFYGAILGGTVTGAWIAGRRDSARERVALVPWIGEGAGASIVAKW